MILWLYHETSSQDFSECNRQGWYLITMLYYSTENKNCNLDCDMCLKGLQDLLRENWLSKVYNTNYKMLTDPKLKINNRKFLILKSIVPVKTQRNFLVNEFMMLTGFVVILKQDKPSFNVFHNYSITLKYQQLNSSRHFQAAFHNYL